MQVSSSVSCYLVICLLFIASPFLLSVLLALISFLVMAENYDSMSSIAPGKDNWSIVVKAVRLWTVIDLNRPNIAFAMEMVLMDDKGTNGIAS